MRVDRCIRCGSNISDFLGLENISYPSPGKDITHCRDCGLIYRDTGGNRIVIFIEIPIDVCRNCCVKFDLNNPHCPNCGVTHISNELSHVLIFTYGLINMILDSRRCWDERYYIKTYERRTFNLFTPKKDIGEHNIGFMMAIMFGYNKNFTYFGFKKVKNDINFSFSNIKYGEVWATISRNECV